MVAMLEPRPASAGQISKLVTKPSWGHGNSPAFCGELARNPSLVPTTTTTTNLGNHNNISLEGIGRQASWEFSSGGAPTLRNFSSESASSWHIALLAMEECITKELELATKSHMLTSLESDGDLVLLLDSVNQVTQQGFELGKGLVNLDHVTQEACSTACKQTKETQTKEQQAACSSTAGRPTANNKQNKRRFSLTRQDCTKVSYTTLANSRSLSKKKPNKQ